MRKTLALVVSVALLIAPAAFPGSGAQPAGFFFEPRDYNMCKAVREKIGLARLEGEAGFRIVRTSNVAAVVFGGPDVRWPGICSLYGPDQGPSTPDLTFFHNASRDFDGYSPVHNFTHSGYCAYRPSTKAAIPAPAQAKIAGRTEPWGSRTAGLCILWRGAYTQVVVEGVPKPRALVLRLYHLLRRAK